MLETGAWLHRAAHANTCARTFAEKIAGLPNIELMFPVEANGVFVKMPSATADALRARDWKFYTFIGGGARFMFAWDTALDCLESLVEDFRAVSTERAGAPALT
jgi:threonine aldolase